VPGLSWAKGSICELPYADQSVKSLSSLHVIEHIGLGRYGDPIEPEAWKKGLSELARVLAPGGQLLIGTPCGRSRTVFHAHRVFSPQQIIDALPELKLIEFSLIEDDSAIKWTQNAKIEDARDLNYGCGLFRFTR
jgi:predicted SAM-dependent methyltransferase